MLSDTVKPVPLDNPGSVAELPYVTQPDPTMRSRHGNKSCYSVTCPVCEEDADVWAERERGPGMGNSFEIEPEHVCPVNEDADEVEERLKAVWLDSFVYGY